ncbi:transcription repressor OFP13-like [Prunus avium]|uniref:Transcription repressor n=1 Tax=Prunus avium TaxID=42229 RepID=A0A6P5STU0_PRUAV|nr:transcription repressor OFP13-like [Prunus avium]
MGKKMKLRFLSKNTEASRHSSSSSSTWPWPSCSQPRTLSFRKGNDIFKTINSAYFDTSTTEVIETPDSFFTNSSESCPSFSTASEDSGLDPVETVIKGLRSERLFFEPKAGETSSIVMEEAAKKAAGGEELNIVPFKESVVLSMDSPDPIVDFRKSMEEMVEAHGLKDWDHLEELLGWYLRINAKSNHGYIVGAFVDLLVGLALSSGSTNCSCSCNINSPSSPLSNFYNSTASTSSLSSSSTPCVSSIEPEEQSESTPCLSSLLEAEEDQIHEEDEASSSSS